VKSGDAYQLVTAGPAWMLLQHLGSIPKKTVQNLFHRATEHL